MKKIKMYAMTSLDGFTARIDGDIDWAMSLLKDRKYNYGFQEFFDTVDCAFINFGYYTLLHSYDLRWQFGDKPCYLIGRKVTDFPKDKDIRSIPLNPDMETLGNTIRELQQSDGKDIWLAGDHKLISTFMELELIDEITKVIVPVTLGNGIPFSMGCSKETNWQTMDVTTYETGVVKIVYRKIIQN